MNTRASDPEAPEPEAPERAVPEAGRLRRIPLWVRVAAPVVIVAGGAALLAGGVAAISGSPADADADALCREAATSRLEQRGHTAIELATSLQQGEADGAQRVSGTLTFVDDAGATHHALLRCVVRADGDRLRVASVRFAD